MKRKMILLATILLLGMLAFGCAPSSGDDGDTATITVSAAASMKDAMDKVIESYETVNEDISVVANYGSSGSLMNQILEGAQVDVFVSAAQSKMDLLEDEDLLLEGSRVDLVKNDLVFIVPKGTTNIGQGDLEQGLVNQIAIGEPESVPAGQYAKEAFSAMGFYDTLENESKLVFGKDVRTVLSWVETANVQGGVVYSSDAIISDNVEISWTIPADSHTPITYPAAIIKDSMEKDTAMDFLEFLGSETAVGIFQEFGFDTVD